MCISFFLYAPSYDTWFWYFLFPCMFYYLTLILCFWVALLWWLLLSLHLFQIVYSVDDTCFLTYCEMVSKQQYEEQKVSVSTEALRNLLHGILMDEKLSEKERKKRIKQVCSHIFFINLNLAYILLFYEGKSNINRNFCLVHITTDERGQNFSLR